MGVLYWGMATLAALMMWVVRFFSKELGSGSGMDSRLRVRQAEKRGQLALEVLKFRGKEEEAVGSGVGMVVDFQ